MTTGQRIRQFRIAKKMTQKELGALCEINEANIRKYESGRQKPKIETLKKIAAALNISELELMGMDVRYVTDSELAEYSYGVRDAMYFGNTVRVNGKYLVAVGDEFDKDIISKAKTPQPLSADHEALQSLMNKVGYHFEKIDDNYFFTGNDGAWKITSDELDMFLNKSVEAIEMLCMKFEKEHQRNIKEKNSVNNRIEFDTLNVITEHRK